MSFCSRCDGTEDGMWGYHMPGCPLRVDSVAPIRPGPLGEVEAISAAVQASKGGKFTQLEVGKLYRTRGGDLAKVIEDTLGGTFTYLAEMKSGDLAGYNFSYTKRGERLGNLTADAFDLVSEEAPIAAPEQARNGGGTKYDDGKSPLAYIPPLAIVEVGFAYWAGAQKYGPFNYMKGLAFTRLAGGSLRHTFLFLAGEDYDVEIFEKYGRKVGHWACAVANLLMLGEMILRGRTDLDDRYKQEEA
jgi:hypothetical protein